MNKISIFIVYMIMGATPISGYSITSNNHSLLTLPKDSLTLEQCIDIALKNSPQIAVAKGDVTKANINLKDARAQFLPELYLLGGYNLNDIYDRLEWNENHYSLTLNASMIPYNGGRNLINVAKSRASLTSAKQGYRLTKIVLILDVIRKYYNLLEAAEILKLRKESLVQKRKHLEFAKAQFDLGLVPKADILKAEVDVASAEVDSLQADVDLKLAHAELNDVMGISLDYPTKIKPVEFIREKPPNFDGCLSEALKNRSELLQQRANLAIKKYNLRLKQVDRLPTFTVTGSYNVYTDKFAFAGLPINRVNWNENTDWRVGVG
ncbi:MAG TPA: TolC family protein, partial [bacterium (Candidatus Stahlbacteria)]|nr:TolC family protein [Candidatus Stahlbacteria bacterium]